MVMLQVYVPVRMISRMESILANGKEFKFRTAPIDPTDPFRGKYITLSFDANSAHVTNAEEWNQGESVYALLGEDEKGFVKINSLSRNKPVDDDNYVKAMIDYIVADTVSYVMVDYSFTRFYMEEYKAPDAQTVYGEAARDTNQVAYALVRIKDGIGVVKDVMINDKPIREAVKIWQEKQ